MKVEELAERIMKSAFVMKKDLSGMPYTSHLYRVRDGLLKQWPSAYGFVIAAALLHDILEDCPEWNAKSLIQVIGIEAVEIIEILTRTEKETYSDYIDRIIASDNNHARLIKIADLEDNMDIKRLNALGEGDFKRLAKYLNAYKKMTA